MERLFKLFRRIEKKEHVNAALFQPADQSVKFVSSADQVSKRNLGQIPKQDRYIFAVKNIMKIPKGRQSCRVLLLCNNKFKKHTTQTHTELFIINAIRLILKKQFQNKHKHDERNIAF